MQPTGVLARSIVVDLLERPARPEGVDHSTRDLSLGADLLPSRRSHVEEVEVAGLLLVSVFPFSLDHPQPVVPVPLTSPQKRPDRGVMEPAHIAVGATVLLVLRPGDSGESFVIPDPPAEARVGVLETPNGRAIVSRVVPDGGPDMQPENLPLGHGSHGSTVAPLLTVGAFDRQPATK